MNSEKDVRNFVRKFLRENADTFTPLITENEKSSQLIIGDPLIDVEMNQMADELGSVPDTLRNRKSALPNSSKSTTTSKSKGPVAPEKNTPPAPEKKDSTPNFLKKDVNSQGKKDPAEKAPETQEMGNKQDSGKKLETDTKKTWQKPWEKTEKEDNEPK